MTEPAAQPKKSLKLGRWLLIALIVGAITGGVQRWMASHAPKSPIAGLKVRDYPDSVLEASAPDSVRIKVEVLNTTKTRGLARRATTYLRDRGFDVVLVGTTGGNRSKTLVLDRSNHPEWSRLVAKAMNGAWESRPDTTKYLDVTVLLGSDWSPPPEPFYP